MNRINCEKIAAAVAIGQPALIRAAVIAALENETGPAWIREAGKFLEFVADLSPRFSVFAEAGNIKLPFVSFSALPGADHCPGAGECLQFCYSFRAWRYPAAFFRQCQNSLLQKSAKGRAHILAALDSLLARPKFSARDSVDFRLFVDGDFTSAGNVRFWMDTLAARPKLAAYGYSKSWREILAFSRRYEFPANYKLNLSSGSIHGEKIKREISALPITRGEFIAVSIGRSVKSADHGTSAHNRELRAAHGGKAFTCPGKCGDCTPQGHACGSARFSGLDIIIAVH